MTALDQLCAVCGKYGTRSSDDGRTWRCFAHDPHNNGGPLIQTAERPPGPSWARFFEGAPGDPPGEEDGWQRNWRIVMQDEQANLLTFSTTSFGGKLAWDELLEAYRADTKHDELWPVVAVRTCYYDTKQYKHVPRPTFEIVSWAEPWASPSGTLPEPDAEAEAIEAPKAKKAAYTEADPPPNMGEHLSDEAFLFGQES